MEQLSTLNGIAYARTVDSMDGHALLGNLIGDQPRNLQEAGLLARIDGENLFMNARAVASNHSLGAQATRFNEAGVRYAFDNGITLTAGKRIDPLDTSQAFFPLGFFQKRAATPTSTTATAMSKARRSSKRNGPANRPRCSSSPEKTARCAATSTTATCRARRNSCAAHTTGRAVRPRCSRAGMRPRRRRRDAVVRRRALEHRLCERVARARHDTAIACVHRERHAARFRGRVRRGRSPQRSPDHVAQRGRHAERTARQLLADRRVVARRGALRREPVAPDGQRGPREQRAAARRARRGVERPRRLGRFRERRRQPARLPVRAARQEDRPRRVFAARRLFAAGQACSRSRRSSPM